MFLVYVHATGAKLSSALTGSRAAGTVLIHQIPGSGCGEAVSLCTQDVFCCTAGETVRVQSTPPQAPLPEQGQNPILTWARAASWQEGRWPAQEASPRVWRLQV